LFRFYTETGSFGVSIKPKQTEDQPKQAETNRNESNMKAKLLLESNPFYCQLTKISAAYRGQLPNLAEISSKSLKRVSHGKLVYCDIDIDFRKCVSL
jgi:hypothetical protein